MRADRRADLPLQLTEPHQQRAERRNRVASHLRHRPVGHHAVQVHPDPQRALRAGAHLAGLRLAHDHPVDAVGRQWGSRKMLGAQHHSFLVGQYSDDDPAAEPGELHGPGGVDHRRHP